MAIRVAINGFGRIGRLTFRHIFGVEGFEVVAINGRSNPRMMAHLLKYDSTQGNYAAQGHVVEACEDCIRVDGKDVRTFAIPNAIDLPWRELDVDVVVENVHAVLGTGMLKEISREKDANTTRIVFAE